MFTFVRCNYNFSLKTETGDSRLENQQTEKKYLVSLSDYVYLHFSSIGDRTINIPHVKATSE